MQQIDGQARRMGPAGKAGRSRVVKARARKLSTKRRSLGQRTLLAFATLMLTAAIATALKVVNDQNEGSAGGGRIDAILTAAGFGIEEVTVTGHAMTSDTEIFDALDLAHVTTMPALRNNQVQERLAQLPWIATATLTRVYPGRIELSVTERVPSALWLDRARAVLIDRSGRTLSVVRPTDLPALPRVAGDGAPDATADLFQMLSHFPQIASRLDVATRIDGRRWSLALSNGIRLELPSEGEATALSGVLADENGRRLLSGRATIIDLRSHTLIAARPAGAS